MHAEAILESPPERADESAPFRREVDAQGICVLTFDRPGSSANIFDEVALHALDTQVSEFEKMSGLRGLIIVSAKPAIFIAGADIKSVLLSDDPSEMGRLISLGQVVFSRLARLRVPKVAAIHGACVGGGYELALACDWRVASPDRVTKIGLPETMLGILPAWGGSTRLPRLIGLPKALGIILEGKVVDARRALKLGMIDEIVPKENLLVMARRLLERGAPERASHGLVNSSLAAAAIRKVSLKKVRAKTRGHYPAIEKALEVVAHGVTLTIDESLALEREAVAGLAKLPSTRHLLGAFLMQERAKKLRYGSSDETVHPVERVAVIGAGVMGAGIAQWLASRGLAVTLCDIAPERVAAGMKTAGDLFDAAMKRGLMSKTEARRAMDRISPVARRVPLIRQDLVIEAAVEEMGLKKKIFADLDARAGEATILATNTSALSVSEIGAATSRPDKVVGLHFFNPVHRMQLVEIVVGRESSETAVRRALAFVKAIGKLPVIVRDHPGFVVNRILMPYLIEAGKLADGGTDPKLIDHAMLDFGMPMGPLRLLDEIGIDVAQHVAGTLHAAFGDRLKPPPLLQRMADDGLLGRKSGKGFYLYDKGKVGAVNPKLASLCAGGNTETDGRAIQERMVALMIDEAARCLEEGVTDSPEDIDFAMMMGTGFAPFRGGLLRHADAIGAPAVAAALENAGYAPSPRLAAITGNGGTFHSSK
jgi:3-hydroxyacyl-CoA dehydrogenase/enoyl-CoA hydratase/3-hydroxybutyryl-CoA epimerase